MPSTFPLAEGLTMLNHASFGLPTMRTLELAAAIRRELDADATCRLWPHLPAQLRDVASQTSRFLQMPAGPFALTANSTQSANALISSVPLGGASEIVLLSDEYSSVMRAWEVAAARAGARCRIVEVPVPLQSGEALIAALDAQVPGRVDYLQASLITSATATLMPVADLGAWAGGRGGALILDAAHGAGHVPLVDHAGHAAVMFGSLHKWLPIPRPAGFLWAAPTFPHVLRPAEVSLSWDAETLADRFAWPGTFDPTPRLCLPDAIAQWTSWQEAGDLAAAQRLADEATAGLIDDGAVCTAAAALRPPRLRSMLLPGVAPERLQEALDAAAVRAWSGPRSDGSILRFSTHVFNHANDVERLVAAVRSAST